MANYAEALSAKAAALKGRNKKPELRSIEVEKAENGGHVVTHRMESGDGPYHEPERFAFGASEGKKLVDHLKQHMGVNVGEKEAAADDKKEGAVQ